MIGRVKLGLLNLEYVFSCTISDKIRCNICDYSFEVDLEIWLDTSRVGKGYAYAKCPNCPEELLFEYILKSKGDSWINLIPNPQTHIQIECLRKL